MKEIEHGCLPIVVLSFPVRGFLRLVIHYSVCSSNIVPIPKDRRGNYIEEGYSMTRTEAPKDLGGRLLRNLARTTPLLPCGLVTLPQMTRILEP